MASKSSRSKIVRSKRNCSFVGCFNSEAKNPELKFYCFPSRSYEGERKKRWIEAVNRITVNGEPWVPSRHSRVCSAHFVDGKKSENMYEEAYVPTIYPTCYKKKIPNREGRQTLKILNLSEGGAAITSNEDEKEMIPVDIIGNEIDTTINNDDLIDLSYFGETIYGSPNNATGEKLTKWHENHPENPEEFGEYAEGDILFPNTLTRNGLMTQSARWKDGIIPYEIAAIFTPNDISIIQSAIAVYHKYTCIKFRPRLPTDFDYLAIVNGNSGCWSSVGRITGRQEVNLQSPYCTTKIGTPMHELMHAIGFLHEQNRWERDSFVSIAWQNIKKGHENNFKKAEEGTTNGFGVQYDYRSVMHYSPTAFSINGEPTIIAKDSSKSKKMGQRDGFSRGDIEKINAMYGCPKVDLNNNINSVDNGDKNKGGGLLSFLFELIS